MTRLVAIAALLATPFPADAYATEISPTEACMGYAEAAEDLLRARHKGTQKNEMVQYSDNKAYLAMVEELFDMPQIDDPAEQAVARVAYGDDTLTACLDYYAEAEQGNQGE